MNLLIDREIMKEKIRNFFHNKDMIINASILNSLIDLLEEETDEAYIQGQKDLADYLKEKHDVNFIKNDQEEFLFIGSISDDYDENIIED